MSLAEYWHPIATAEEVTSRPRQFRLLGERLVAFRVDGRVSVLADLCIHRGAALSLGTLTDDGRLVCGYHGWQYDHTGACVRIPALPPDSSIPRKARTRRYDSCERYGLVWVRLTAEGVGSPPDWPDDEYSNPAFYPFTAGDYVWNTSAGRAVENFMDFSHFPFVHSGLLGSPDHTEVKPHTVEPTACGFRYHYQGMEPGGYYDGSPGTVALVHRDYEVFMPFTIHSRKRDPDGKATTISLFVCPLEPTQCRLWVMVLRNHSCDSTAEIAAWNEQFVGFNDRVMEQDRLVVESQRPERIPLDLREELHIKVPDAAAIAYRRLLAEASGEVVA